MSLWEKIDYDVGRFPFSAWVAKLIGCEGLHRLHLWRNYNRLVTDAKSPLSDQGTMFHQRYYGAIDSTYGERFLNNYRGFLKEIVRPRFNEPLVFQNVPTLRVMLPENVAVGEFHRDGDYNHPDGEITVWIPLTPAMRSAAMQIAVGDQLIPMELQNGQVALVDTRNLLHGNTVNLELYTRVSLDTRVMPLSKYQATGKHSIAHGLRFERGFYYASDILP